MAWRILMVDVYGQRYTSSALRTEADARSFARELLKTGDMKILRIENERGETIDLEEIEPRPTRSNR